MVTSPLRSLGTGHWVYHEPPLQTVLPANGDIWQNSHAATRRWQEPSLHHRKAGYSLRWEQPLDTRPVTVLELSPEDTHSQLLPKHGTAGEMGMQQAGVQGGNWEII